MYTKIIIDIFEAMMNNVSLMSLIQVTNNKILKSFSFFFQVN